MHRTALDLRERAAIILVVGAFLISAAVNFYNGDIGLRPVATICAVILALIAGLWPGLFFAVAVTALWVWIGFAAPWSSPASRSTLSSLIFFAANVIGVVIAAKLRDRIAQNAALSARLGASDRERGRLAELEATRQQLEVSERRYRTVGEFIPFGVWQTDVDGRLVYVSQTYLDMLGETLEGVQGGGWASRVPAEDRERFLAAWSKRDQSSGAWECEYRIRGANGKLYNIQSRGTRLTDDRGQLLGWIGVSYDVTDAKRAADRLNFLAEAGRLLTSSLDPDTTLERIAALCVPQLADWCNVDLLEDDGSLKAAAIRHADPAKIEWVRALQSEYPPMLDESNVAYQVVQTGQAMVFTEIPDEMLQGVARDERHLAILRQLGMSSAMVVPLNARGRRLGVVTFVDAESQRRFDESDLEFAVILCARAALAYDNARLFAKEQHVAETFQAASLPTELPQMPGVRLSATYRAGRNESEVGGDWYDAFELPDGNLVVSIGDVAGKGLAAAVSMSAVRQILSASAFEGAGPADILRRCNRVLCHRGAGIVTAAIGILNPESRTFTFSSAGHPAILYADPTGLVQELTAAGIPLGIMPEYGYTEQKVNLEKSGILVMYTDGLTEFNRDITTGERDLRRVIGDLAGTSVPALAETIVRNTVSGKALDDIAVLALELDGDHVQVLDVEVPASVTSVRAIRRSVRRLCMANGLSDDQMFRVLVATGEAISNAIEHAYLDDGGTIRVKGSRQDGALIIEVSDAGRWRGGQRIEGGRGLQLMRSLMDEVIIDRSDAGTAIRQRISLGGN